MAAVIGYLWPTTGTTPPVTSGTFSELIATLTWLDADTTATITHDFALSAVELTQGFPLVALAIDSTSTGTVNGVVLVQKLTNTLVLTKASAAGSGGVLQVQALRSTIIR